MSAAVGYKGPTDIVVFGFPFEAIISESHRNEIMTAIMEFFEKPMTQTSQ
jgi:hypothetical protein